MEKEKNYKEERFGRGQKDIEAVLQNMKCGIQSQPEVKIWNKIMNEASQKAKLQKVM